MNGQMTIWDYLPAENLEDIPEDVMARRIGDAIGVTFTWDDFFEEYRAKVGKWILSVNYSRYFANVDDNEGRGARFISCDYQSNRSGKSAPRDSIKEAIEWFLKNKEEK